MQQGAGEQQQQQDAGEPEQQPEPIEHQPLPPAPGVLGMLPTASQPVAAYTAMPMTQLLGAHAGLPRGAPEVMAGALQQQPHAMEQLQQQQQFAGAMLPQPVSIAAGAPFSMAPVAPAPTLQQQQQQLLQGMGIHVGPLPSNEPDVQPMQE